MNEHHVPLRQIVAEIRQGYIKKRMRSTRVKKSRYRYERPSIMTKTSG
jgi:hypothetical protein